MTNAKPMTNARRIDVYIRSGKMDTFSSKQQRRYNKKYDRNVKRANQS